MGSYLMIVGFLALSLLLAITGVWMLAGPRRFAAVCEVFAAGGNLPSFLPRSVKGALAQIRVLGLCGLAMGLALAAGTVAWSPTLIQAASGTVKLYWLVFPAALGLSAGYVILFHASDWVVRTFQRWMDHPLVPQDLVFALTWELRIGGVAFSLFGLGAMAIWLKSLLG
jgi:hypothetical protein